MAFTQTMRVKSTSAKQLTELMAEWHDNQSGTAPGYEGARLLAERDGSGELVIEVDFSSEEEAKRNNDRPETKAWAERLKQVVDGEPEYKDFEVVYSTG